MPPETAAGLTRGEKLELLRRIQVERISRLRSVPASFAQERLWFLQRLEPGRAERRAAEDAARPFDLEAGPLFRAALLRPDDDVLLLCMHHTVSDAWSVEVLFRGLPFLKHLVTAAHEGLFRGTAVRPSKLGDGAIACKTTSYTDWRDWMCIPPRHGHRPEPRPQERNPRIANCVIGGDECRASAHAYPPPLSWTAFGSAPPSLVPA
ncbi:MAG: condensation domain-containing protein [Longimicrobiaceae bacterium]